MEENDLNIAERVHKSNEDSLFFLIDLIKEYSSIFFGAIIITSLTGLVYALIATPLYRADVIMISNAAEGEALNNLARQYSSLARIAGIDVGGDASVDDQDRSLAILTSRSFIEEFAQKRNIKPILFKESWDEDKKEWEDGIEPSAAQTFKIMSNYIDVAIDKRTNLINFSVVWDDPNIAAEVANKMIADLNEKIRLEQVNEYNQSISFVKAQLGGSQQDYLLSMNEFSKSSKLTLQNVMLSLIEELTKKVMLANVRDEYAFKIIDPAVVPEIKYKPSKKNIVIIVSILGSVLAFFLILSISYTKKLKSKYQLYTKQA